MCLIPNKTRPSWPSSAGAAAAATVPGGGSELGPPHGLSPGSGRREVVVRGCAVPIQAKHGLSLGHEMLCCSVQDGFRVHHLVSSPIGMGRSRGWVQGRVSVGAAWVTLPAAPGHGHEDVCWEDVKLFGVRPGCGCCRAWGCRQRVGAARLPRCLCGTAGARGAAHRAWSCLHLGCPSCWPRRSC